jgi:3-hydroxyacyl-CoA dehydrogenase/enoyl-CoA hydratase/3-hydroxybutyryl-CoA epimerase
MSFHYDKDSNNIVTVTMDMDGPVNAMSDAFLPLLEATLDKLEAETDLTGVVLTSVSPHFLLAAI